MGRPRSRCWRKDNTEDAPVLRGIGHAPCIPEYLQSGFRGQRASGLPAERSQTRRSCPFSPLAPRNTKNALGCGRRPGTNVSFNHESHPSHEFEPFTLLSFIRVIRAIRGFHILLWPHWHPGLQLIRKQFSVSRVGSEPTLHAVAPSLCPRRPLRRKRPKAWFLDEGVHRPARGTVPLACHCGSPKGAPRRDSTASANHRP